MNAAVERNKIKRNPFHPFSSFDTATLAGVAFGQTVLARACEAAGIAFDAAEAHSALYDCEKTAQLFADVVNRWPFPKISCQQNANPRLCRAQRASSTFQFFNFYDSPLYEWWFCLITDRLLIGGVSPIEVEDDLTGLAR